MINFEKTAQPNKIEEIKNVLEKGEEKLKLILLRHGPKKEAAGEKDELAEYFVQNVQDGLDSLDLDSPSYIHLSSSPAGRAKSTEDVASDHLGGRIKRRPTNDALGSFESLDQELKLELNNLVEYQKKLEDKFKVKEMSQVDIKDKIDSAIMEHMFDGTLDKLQKELDLDVPLNLKTEDFSNILEAYTKGFLKHLSLLKSKTEKPVSLNITHSYPVMSFLKNNLKFIEDDKIKSAKEMSGKDFLVAVNGCIREAQAVNLGYMQDGDKKLIKVTGNNFSGYIDYE